jgi:hypothetical protein
MIERFKVLVSRQGQDFSIALLALLFGGAVLAGLL